MCQSMLWKLTSEGNFPSFALPYANRTKLLLLFPLQFRHKKHSSIDKTKQHSSLRLCVGYSKNEHHEALIFDLNQRVITSCRSRIRRPLPQEEARIRPMIAIATTEQAEGTAWILPRNWVARRPASVELCIPVQSESVLDTSSSCLQSSGVS